ncbi:MAG TPA: thioredoxin-disulfide reductase [Candidatus Nanoarchaeia archaeon]|nr:thioredoxin-disulfide reductase [Candidatus Nanoarchaeia archaeon]
MYDVIILGAGAAGMTAAIYTCRKKLKTAILSIDVGGQTNLTNHIENYPGTGPMSGPELMQRFQSEAVGFGAEIIMGKATKADKTSEGFKVTLANDESYECKALILAYGKVPRSLGVENEDKFLGRGVSTCVTCDAPLYKNREVAVIGGGNSAVEGALELATLAKKVYLIHRRDAFRADEVTVEKLKGLKNVELVLNSASTKVIGDKNVDGIEVENLVSKEKRQLKVEGIFIEIGYIVDTSFVQHLVKVNDKKEIIVDERGNTSYPGIFAAGDITPVPYKQTVIAAGEGAKAALECYRWLTGGKGTALDWTH